LQKLIRKRRFEETIKIDHMDDGLRVSELITGLVANSQSDVFRFGDELARELVGVSVATQRAAAKLIAQALSYFAKCGDFTTLVARLVRIEAWVEKRLKKSDERNRKLRNLS
jgi:hypothetical protein